MAKTFTARTIIEITDEDGATCKQGFDEILTLSGFDEFTVKRLKLPTSAADQAVTFTDALALFVFSHTNPFSYRNASTEELQENVMQVLKVADDTADGIQQTSILLTAWATATADLEIWIVEKP